MENAHHGCKQSLVLFLDAKAFEGSDGSDLVVAVLAIVVRLSGSIGHQWDPAEWEKDNGSQCHTGPGRRIGMSSCVSADVFRATMWAQGNLNGIAATRNCDRQVCLVILFGKDVVHVGTCWGRGVLVGGGD